MPFKSEKQRRFMHAKHPQIAKRWEHKYGSKPDPQREALRSGAYKRKKHA